MPKKNLGRVEGLLLRPIKQGELPQLVSVWKSSGLPTRLDGRDSMPNLRKQLKRDPALFIGAFQGAELVGAAIASDDGRKGWINRLAVVPKAQGRGIAAALISACEGVLRKRGRLLVAVLIEDYNKTSMKLFEREGYVREPEILHFTKREDKRY